MSDLISTIQTDVGANEDKSDDDEENEESNDIETTSLKDIDDFNRWAKTQASKDLSQFKNLTSVCDINQLRSNISSLNCQQRRLFDDFTERCISSDVNERPVYLLVKLQVEIW